MTAKQRSAPRIGVTMAAAPANRPAKKAAPRRGAPSSARRRPTAAAIEAAVVNQWWLFSQVTRTAHAIESSAARGRLSDERRAAAQSKAAISVMTPTASTRTEAKPAPKRFNQAVMIKQLPGGRTAQKARESTSPPLVRAAP